MRTRPRRTITLGGGLRVPALPPDAIDATRERLQHAIDDRGAALEQQGVRRVADGFDLLRARQALDRSDPDQNDALWQAGDRFRRHWHLSRLDGLKAFDFSRESVDGSGFRETTPTERTLKHRQSYLKAAEAVGPRLMPYLAAIVIEGRPAADLAGLVVESGHARTAEALVKERLREALHRLCDHWDMKPLRRLSSR